MRKYLLCCCAILSLLLIGTQVWAAPPPRVPVLLDTDLGNGVDEAFALALILGSPELELRGVTTVSGDTNVRAMMACRFLTMTGRRHTPVAAGAEPQPKSEIRGQYQYYYHPDVLFNRTTKPVKEPAVEFLNARLKGQSGQITILATGPLTNIARLLREYPDSKRGIKRIILHASNFRADIKAAREVLASEVPLVVIPPHMTKYLLLTNQDARRVFAPVTALSLQVQALYQLANEPTTILAAPLVPAIAFEERFVKFEDQSIDVNLSGDIVPKEGKPNARVVVKNEENAFLKWYVERMASLLPPERVPAKLLPQGKMPTRVHVAEDFDTNIERRWWMSGKEEVKILRPGGNRACRGVLTHDFDDLLGNPKAMWTAVIFNPVPGPPMGPNTRLSFRYWLKGTDKLRVQIYSLTNGYHRHLILKNLPQEKWQDATVDMTVARRPDGSGGPLSEDERIDDIQFYADPTAELVIDDIILCEADPPDEKRPFPKRVHFTGLFDTGKQGKEWPGDFEIVPHKPPLKWKAAKSIINATTGDPWIRLHLRGERPMGETTHLRFRYHLTGADALRVVLTNRTAKDTHTVELKDLGKEKWAETTVDFTRAKRSDGSEGGPRKGDRTDEIRFLLPRGAELLLDDVLLYEPGSSNPFE
jgi:inosine-uridine nucleoside N-ribohydrolase